METVLAQKELEESRGHSNRMLCILLECLCVRLGCAGHLRGGEAEGWSFGGRGQKLRAARVVVPQPPLPKAALETERRTRRQAVESLHQCEEVLLAQFCSSEVWMHSISLQQCGTRLSLLKGCCQTDGREKCCKGRVGGLGVLLAELSRQEAPGVRDALALHCNWTRNTQRWLRLSGSRQHSHGLAT